jgi:hypothetical protein
VLGVGVAALLWKSGNQAVPGAFVAPQQSGARSRTAMRGFKEDFDAWRSALTPEEKALVQKQAKGEFNKKFRKTDEFKVDLPEDKVQAFSKILGKFFEAEVEDYKKDAADKVADPDGLLFKGGEAKIDFGLRGKIVEIDRDADRRYYFSTMRTQQANAKGTFFPSSSPLMEHFSFQSNDTESKEKIAKTMEVVKKIYPEAEASEFEDTGNLMVSEVLIKQLATTIQGIDAGIEKAIAEDESKKEALVKAGQSIKSDAAKFLFQNWAESVKKIEADVEGIKAFFDSQTNPEGKTKADVLKEVYAVMQDRAKNKLPPLDEDLVAELSEIPAVPEGSLFKHPWGTASKLYKSEAVDAFGFRYLLGVFETKDEAAKAFKKWNGEYEQSRKDMETELAQWSKQEQARLDADVYGQEAMKAVMDEGRA